MFQSVDPKKDEVKTSKQAFEDEMVHKIKKDVLLFDIHGMTHVHDIV